MALLEHVACQRAVERGDQPYLSEFAKEIFTRLGFVGDAPGVRRRTADNRVDVRG